jgi:hypothetical protein
MVDRDLDMEIRGGLLTRRKRGEWINNTWPNVLIDVKRRQASYIDNILLDETCKWARKE